MVFVFDRISLARSNSSVYRSSEMDRLVPYWYCSLIEVVVLVVVSSISSEAILFMVSFSMAIFLSAINVCMRANVHSWFLDS